MPAPHFVTRVLTSGLTGTVMSSAAVLLLSARRDGHPWRGLNCTAHWLHGDEAADFGRCDLAHTATGFATNLGATFFWAVFYEAALGANPSWLRFAGVTAALGPVSAIVDYRATPKRLTPGWELIFGKREMTTIYGALVLGMAAGSGLVRCCGRKNCG